MQRKQNGDYSVNFFGYLVKEARIEQKLKAKDLAEMVGASPSYITQIESGKVPSPAITIIAKLVSVLNLNWKDVFKVFNLENYMNNLPTKKDWDIFSLFDKSEMYFNYSYIKDNLDNKDQDKIIRLSKKEKLALANIIYKVLGIKFEKENQFERIAGIIDEIDNFIKI